MPLTEKTPREERLLAQSVTSVTSAVFSLQASVSPKWQEGGCEEGPGRGCAPGSSSHLHLHGGDLTV